MNIMPRGHRYYPKNQLPYASHFGFAMPQASESFHNCPTTTNDKKLNRIQSNPACYNRGVIK